MNVMHIRMRHLRRTCAGMLAVLAATAFGGGIRAQEPERFVRLGEEPAGKVQVTRGVIETRERIAKPLQDSGGRLILLSRTDFIRIFLLPLHREGLLKECVVILPFDNALTVGKTGPLLEAMKHDEVSETDRNGFSIDNGTFRGRIEGMPLVFATLSTISNGTGAPAAVAIESAFFQELNNEIKNPVTLLVRKLLATLRDRQVAATGVLVIDASDRSDFPLENGFVAKLMQEAFANPGAFTDGLPPKWEAFSIGELARYFSQYPEAFAAYRKFIESEPDEASTCYKIAMMAVRDLDVPFALQWINRAASADPRYHRAYIELASYLYGKDMFDPAERVIRAGLSRFPKDQVLATGLANFHIARGEAAREAGDPDLAEANLRAAAEVAGAERETIDKALRLLKKVESPAGK